MKGKKVEFFIFKMYRKVDGGPQEWEGPYRTLKAAQEAYREYAAGGFHRDFRIFKSTIEPVPERDSKR